MLHPPPKHTHTKMPGALPIIFGPMRHHAWLRASGQPAPGPCMQAHLVVEHQAGQAHHLVGTCAHRRAVPVGPPYAEDEGAALVPCLCQQAGHVLGPGARPSWHGAEHFRWKDLADHGAACAVRCAPSAMLLTHDACGQALPGTGQAPGHAHWTGLNQPDLPCSAAPGLHHRRADSAPQSGHAPLIASHRKSWPRSSSTTTASPGATAFSTCERWWGPLDGCSCQAGMRAS